MSPRPRPRNVSRRDDDDVRKGPRLPHPGGAGKRKEKRDPSGHKTRDLRPAPPAPVKPQRVPHPGKSSADQARAKAEDDDDADDKDEDFTEILGFDEGADDDGDDADDGEDADDDGEEIAEAGDLADADGIIDTESPGFSERKPTFTLGRKSGGNPTQKPGKHAPGADAGSRRPKADPTQPTGSPGPKAARPSAEDKSAHDLAGKDALTKEKLDGEGRRYVTLAQFLKHIDVAPTGGAAKAMARSGTILVGGESESRPGRKLHQGDEVIVDGKPYRVDLG